MLTLNNDEAFAIKKDTKAPDGVKIEYYPTPISRVPVKVSNNAGLEATGVGIIPRR